MNQWQKTVEQLAKREAERQSQEMLERVIKIITATYSSARAYTNVVIIAGYAAFFAMWSFSRGMLNDMAEAVAALSMIVSATAFASFETYKMIWVGTLVRRKTKAIGLAPERALERIQALEGIEQQELKTFGKIWVFVLLVTIPSALIAVGILAVSFIIKIVDSLP